MRTVLTVLGCWAVLSVPAVLVAARLLRRANRVPAAGPCGEAGPVAGSSPVVAHTFDGGHEPRGGGDLQAPRRPGFQVSDNPRPSVPPHERLLNYRPAPENRHWVNDYALAGAIDAWSQEGSR